MKSTIPLNLRTRAATATALGVAAANAKLLADQEEREIGHLVATMIEAQVPFSIPQIIQIIVFLDSISVVVYKLQCM